MSKITINGKEYDFSDPDELKKIMESHNDGFSPSEQGLAGSGDENMKIFTDNNIVAGNKVYKSLNDLPPELRAKIQQNLGKLKNIPFAKSMLKMYGLDIDNPGNMQQNSGNNPFGNNYQSSDPFKNIPSSNSPFNNQPSNPFGSSGKSSMGLIITVVALLGVGGFVAFMIFGINFITSSWEETFELTGDPTHFDPIASVNEVRSHIDTNAKLSSIDIMYVRSDGTMDLKVTSYRPNVTYDFYRELAEPPKDAPPVGAGGTTTGKWYEPVEADVYEPGQWRHVSKMGGGVSTEYSYMNKGIDLDRSDPTTSPDTFVDDPKCSAKDLWKIAIQKGAPADAVANIDYDDGGYNFYISNADINLDFGMDCKLKGDDAPPVPEQPADPVEPTDPMIPL